MSEQLETIKCVDWTINFPGAVGGGEPAGREPICRGRAFLGGFKPLEVNLVNHIAIHPS